MIQHFSHAVFSNRLTRGDHQVPFEATEVNLDKHKIYFCQGWQKLPLFMDDKSEGIDFLPKLAGVFC